MRLRWGLVVALTLVAACGSEDTADPRQQTPPSTSASTTTERPASTPSTIPLVLVDPNDVDTDPSSTTPPTTSAETAPATAPPPSAPIPATSLPAAEQPTVEQIGPGRPQWFSTDASTVVVSSRTGPPSARCEGSGEPELFRQPLADQPRSVAVLGQNADAVGVATRPEPARLALAEGCLGAPLRLWIGDESPNGLAARMVDRPLSQAVTASGLMTPSADGRAFIGTSRPTGPGVPEVVRVDAETGQVTTLFAGDYLEVIELVDGTFVVLGAREARLLEADGTLVDALDGEAIGASPDRSVYVIFTQSTIEVGDIDADDVQSVARPADGSDSLGTYRPVVDDDRTVVFTRRAGRANPVWELRPDGALVELLPADEWGDLVASVDGTLLATSRPAGDPEQPFAEDAVLIRR